MAGTFGKTKAKTQNQTSVVYGAFQLIRFPGNTGTGIGTTIANNNANTVVSSRIVLPFAFKIFGLYVNPGLTGGTLPAATASVNVVLGPGAEAGTVPPQDTSDAPTNSGYPATVATAGQSIFVSDKRVDNIAGLTLDVPIFLVADNPDAIWPELGLLTLRLFTNGTGTFTNVDVYIAGKPVDNQPTHGSINNLAPTDL